MPSQSGEKGSSFEGIGVNGWNSSSFMDGLGAEWFFALCINVLQQNIFVYGNPQDPNGRRN